MHYKNRNALTNNALWRTFLNISSSSKMASTTTAITSTTTSETHTGAGLIDIAVWVVLAVTTKIVGSRGSTNPQFYQTDVWRKHSKSKTQSESRSTYAHVTFRLLHASLHCFFILCHWRYWNRLLLPNALWYPRSFCNLAAVADISSTHSLTQFCEFPQLFFAQLFCISSEDLRSGFNIRQSEVQLKVKPAQKRLNRQCIILRQQSPDPSSDLLHISGCFASYSPRPCSCSSCQSPRGIATMSIRVFVSPRAYYHYHGLWPDYQSTDHSSPFPQLHQWRWRNCQSCYTAAESNWVVSHSLHTTCSSRSPAEYAYNSPHPLNRTLKSHCSLEQSIEQSKSCPCLEDLRIGWSEAMEMSN